MHSLNDEYSSRFQDNQAELKGEESGGPSDWDSLCMKKTTGHMVSHIYCCSAKGIQLPL